jgi:mevalonate kinase
VGTRTVAAGHVRDVAGRAALQRYIRSANKAARAAEAAILDGDVDEAYRQKQAQLLNHALLAEAKAAADRIDKIVARMKKLAGRAAMKSVDPEYLDRVHMLLEDYDFRAAHPALDR